VSEENDLTHKVNVKIDDVLELLNTLIPKVATLTEKLAKADAKAVRDAFDQKQGANDGG
jgi:hypothetical protein